MSAGFIKPVNGKVRMRFVKPGYDARDLNLPPNAVIFDSEANEYLQVFVSGTLLISDGSRGEYSAVTWPTLGYTPFAWAIFRQNDFSIAPVLSAATAQYAPGAVSILSDGLRVETRGLNYPVSLDYIVFRTAAYG